jgi:hypothetical protein
MANDHQGARPRGLNGDPERAESRCEFARLPLFDVHGWKRCLVLCHERDDLRHVRVIVGAVRQEVDAGGLILSSKRRELREDST